MVIEHQRNAGAHQYEKGSEGQCAQIPRRAEAEHSGPHLGREKVEEYVLLHSESPVQRTGSSPTAEHRTPNPGAAQLVEIVRDCFRHAHTLTNCMERIVMERSTIRSPSSLIQVCSQGSGLGAGPSILTPSRLNLLPWQGHAMMPNSGFHAVRQPRWVQTALSAKKPSWAWTR